MKVNPDLSLPGRPEVFAIGDMALVMQEDGKPVPGVSPAAMQEAAHVARLIEDELATPARSSTPARHSSIGTRARWRPSAASAAVAWAGPFKLHGFVAWVAWLFMHLIFLIGFRNKLAVLLQWAYSYFTYQRGARIITSLPGQSVESDS